MREVNSKPIKQQPGVSNSPPWNKLEKDLDKFLDWNRKKFIKFAQIGLIIFILGLLIFSIINISSSFDFGNSRDTVNNIFRIIKIGAISLFYVGVLLFILSMFTIALHDEDMHINLRAALMIAIGLIIGVPLYLGLGI